MENLCPNCPDGTRGICCHINVPMDGHNIVLDHVHCPRLDKKTQLCSDYENRKKFAPWCLHGENMFGKGGLPKDCLYLKDNPEKEPNPKVRILDLPFHEQQKLVGLYNVYNNVPFKVYVELGLEK